MSYSPLKEEQEPQPGPSGGMDTPGRSSPGKSPGRSPVASGHMAPGTSPPSGPMCTSGKLSPGSLNVPGSLWAPGSSVTGSVPVTARNGLVPTPNRSSRRTSPEKEFEEDIPFYPAMATTACDTSMLPTSLTPATLLYGQHQYGGNTPMTEKGMLPPGATSNEEALKMMDILRNNDQGHLMEGWAPVGEHLEEKSRFFSQVSRIDSLYPGGIPAYIANAKKALEESANDVNPLDGYSPKVPEMVKVDWQDEGYDLLEKKGLGQMPATAFVIVAGGLGERLGHEGIKLGLPIDLVTGTSYLEYYCRWVKQMSDRAKVLLPLCIMTSRKTHADTLQLMAKNNSFGLDVKQITFMIQNLEAPGLVDNDAHFTTMPNDPYTLLTKPHGHGDIHARLLKTGLAKKWESEGFKWLCVLQDTNALAFRIIPAMLAISAEKQFEVNFCCVPRKPKEESGSIIHMVRGPEEATTMNVEYNQLEPFLKSAQRKAGLPEVGDAADETGFSPYPGNINLMVYAMEPYMKTLTATKGIVPEFINPKYVEGSRTQFKSPARLECMMQDYVKCLPSTAKVGVTYAAKRHMCYSPVKNNLEVAIQKAALGTHPASASTSDVDQYVANAALLEMAGVEVERDLENLKPMGPMMMAQCPFIQLLPEFGTTSHEIKDRINANGRCTISKRSSLILDGDITINHLELDGALVVRALPGCSVSIDYLKVKNKGWELKSCAPGQIYRGPELMRGYKLYKHEEKTFTFEKPGKYPIRELMSKVRVVMVGATDENFGGPHYTGVCNRANALQLREDVKVVAIVDPNVQQAKNVLKQRQKLMPAKWEGVAVYPSVKEMLETMPKQSWPSAAIVSMTPCQHGTTKKKEDVELVLGMAGISMLVHPPLAALPTGPDEDAGQTGLVAHHLGDFITQKYLVASVGYSLRYSRAVEKMWDILKTTRAPITTVMCRLNIAYGALARQELWDTKQNGGSVVCHASHALDLCRLFAGDVDLSTIQAAAIPNIPLRGMPKDLESGRSIEGTVEKENRMPRITTANWRYKSGALGSFTMGFQLHSITSSFEIEIWADGLRVVLVDPMSASPVISVRRPFSNKEETIEMHQSFVTADVTDSKDKAFDTDPCFLETVAFIQAIKGKQPEVIRSHYPDAQSTHELAFAIQQASLINMPVPPVSGPAPEVDDVPTVPTDVPTPTTEPLREARLLSPGH